MKTTTTKRAQRDRWVTYTVATPDEEGFLLLGRLHGFEQAVKLMQEPFIARNPLLSKWDNPPKDEEIEEVGAEVEFNLLHYLEERKSGASRTKWGELKHYVDRAKALLKGNGEEDADESRIRTVAERLKKAAEEDVNGLLG